MVRVGLGICLGSRLRLWVGQCLVWCRKTVRVFLGLDLGLLLGFALGLGYDYCCC
jgi:hypothetical protein